MKRTRLSGTNPTAELTPAVIAIVLEGWCARPREGGDPKAGDGVLALAGGWGAAAPREDDGVFDLRQSHDAGVLRVWRRNEAFLRAEAKRLGIAPSWGPIAGRML